RVLHDGAPHNGVTQHGTSANPLSTHPRILVVLFKSPNRGFIRMTANHTLIPRREDPVMSDRINGGTGGGLTIADGVLKVSLGWFPSAGGWEIGQRTFTFSWRNHYLVLIGFDSSTTNRRSGQITKESYNYLTRRSKQVIDDI